MFAKLYNSARSILSRSPSTQGRESQPAEKKPTSQGDAEEDMVTTRAAANGTNTPNATARKGKRGLGDEDKAATATKRRKQAKPEDEVNGEVAKENDESAGANPPSASQDPSDTPVSKTKRGRAAKKASTKAEEPVEKDNNTPRRGRRRASPKVVVPEEEQLQAQIRITDSAVPTPTTQNTKSDAASQDIADEAVEEVKGPASGSKKKAKGKKVTKTEVKVVVELPLPTSSVVPLPTGSVEADDTSRFPDEIPSSTAESTPAAEDPVEEPTPVPVRSRKGRKAKMDGGHGPPEIPSSTADTSQATIPTQPPSPKPTPPTAKKTAHIRFGSEEPAPAPIQAPKPTASNDVDNEDSGSDSDEAPETLTAATALSKAKAAQEEAKRAHEAQEAAARLKKQQRAERIAEEQRQKKKREDKKAKKEALREAKATADASDSDDTEIPDVQEDGEAEAAIVSKPNKPEIPALLPDALLALAGDKRPPTPPPTQRASKSSAEIKQEKLAKHIKFLERGDKPLKDVRKGPVNVHVLEQRNEFLAPKVSRDSKGVRDHWLKGREVEAKRGRKGMKKLVKRKVERRGVVGGFLRGVDE